MAFKEPRHSLCLPDTLPEAMPTDVTIGIATVSLLRPLQCYKHLPWVPRLSVSSNVLSTTPIYNTPVFYEAASS